jgi:hypothetical protein
MERFHSCGDGLDQSVVMRKVPSGVQTIVGDAFLPAWSSGRSSELDAAALGLATVPLRNSSAVAIPRTPQSKYASRAPFAL